MKKLKTLLMIIGLFTFFQSNAQISVGGIPPSFAKTTNSSFMQKISVPALEISTIEAEDAITIKDGSFPKVAKAIPVNYNMQNSGTWTVLPGRGKIWQLKIQSSGAKALSLMYDNFYLPKGTQLFLYNTDKSQVIGAFTDINNSESGKFCTELIQGEEVTLEYFEPSNDKSTTIYNPIINISGIIYAYRDVEKLFKMQLRETGWGQSESCEVNVNCPEGTNWQKQKRGVAEIFCTEDGSSFGWCSGTLVNNTSQDGTPLFLTADHCGGGAAASVFAYWQFYFNFEASGCSNPSSQPAYNTITGATRKSRGNMSGGSDFLLLQLNSTPPSNYNIYYNGWDKTNTGSNTGVSIHHPAGDIKKISTYTSALTTTSYSGCMASSHWQVQWASTQTNHGVTEGGSSGSPLFNSAGLQIGTLTGGSSYCNAQTSPDDYGKLFKHWDQNGTTSAVQLKPWLDPSNSGVSQLTGYDPNAIAAGPIANFTANATTISAGNSINFSSTSTTPTGTITTYAWQFQGGNPSTSTSATPSVTYTNAGAYNVSLTVTNSGGQTNTKTTNSYITVTAPVTCADLSTNYTMGFETIEDFNGWTVANVANDTSTWKKFNNATYANTGTYSMSYIYNGDATTPGNDWLFTKCLTLEAGQQYELSLWYRMRNGSSGTVYPEKLKISYGSQASVTGMTQLISDLGEVNNAAYRQGIYNFTPSASGTYYIGFQCYSDADKYQLFIDDIQLKKSTSTPAQLASLSTTVVSAILSTTASSGGSISNDGGANITAKGICWSTSQNPVVTGLHTTDGTGNATFTSSMTGLTANTTYYVRAYATNSAGTAYGNQVSFTTAVATTNDYNTYYGILHNHTSISDGTGTASQAYSYARNTAGLDFFSLADHSGSISATEWTTTKDAANAANVDGSFVAFWGFEWTSGGNYGHVAVIGTDDYCTTSGTTNTFSGLCSWLNTRNGVAFFNHPGRENDNSTEFNHFTTTPSDKFVGMELWNKSDAFSEYFYNDGYNTGDGGLSYYAEALANKWKIGAAGSDDNHDATWGTDNDYRLAVLATAKTRTAIFEAIQQKRFFSTLDKNLRLSFKLNGQEMGSTVNAGNLTLVVSAADGDNESFNRIQLYKNGIVAQTWTPNQANATATTTITAADGDFYYITVRQTDGDEAVSSPIYISGVSSNQNPTVSITSPANNTSYTTGTTVEIAATASDADGSISKVEFYQGTTLLGEDLTSPYTYSWINVGAGNYSITAKAYDNLNAIGTSAPIQITVSSPITCENINTNYTMGFETTEDFNGWSIANVASDTSTWKKFNNVSYAHSGTVSMSYIYNGDATTPGNDWLFTKCLNLEAGQQYELSLWYRMRNGSTGTVYPEKLKISYGSQATVAGMTQLINDLGEVNNATYQQGTYNFTPTASGTYYIGFNCYSDADKYQLFIDDIQLKKTINPVTGISVTPTTLSLIEGGSTAQLTATIAPANASNQNVTWLSSNTNIASVSNTGVVTPIAVGNCNITVTSVDGNLSAICAVTVSANVVSVNGISVTPTTLSLIEGGSTAQLTATIAPANATNQNVTWLSSNPSIASVSSAGVVTPIAVGNCNITVTSVDGNLSAVSAVTVSANAISVTGISVTPTTLSLIQGGNTAQLTATIAPANATNQNVTWLSSNPSIASVSNTGVVTPLAVGNCNITVTSVDGNLSAVSAVTVSANIVPVTWISVSPTTLSLIQGGSTAQLTATVLPANATNQAITWNSSNVSIASVSATGLVTPISVGNCYILVTTVDGGISAICNVTVSSNNVSVASISVNPTTLSLFEGGNTSQLMATIVPSNATNQNVTWLSSNPNIASVSNTGVVSPIAVGNCNITATSVDGNLSAVCAVNVSSANISVLGVTIDPSNLTLIEGGNTAQLTATINPSNAANQTLSWISSNPLIASVSNNGLVTPLSTGSCNITVTTDDGNFNATCAVIVTPLVSVENIENNSVTLHPNPSTGLVYTNIKSSDLANLNVMDILGKKVNVSIINNANSTILDFSSMENGIYIIDITKSKINTKTKIVICK
ncbi:MAG: Ig-like domain-containing protein [Bacteroidota bacterium]